MMTRIGRLLPSAVHLLEQQPGGALGHLLDRLAHGGQRRSGALGDAEVVVADHGDVVGHPPTERPRAP